MPNLIFVFIIFKFIFELIKFLFISLCQITLIEFISFPKHIQCCVQTFQKFIFISVGHITIFLYILLYSFPKKTKKTTYNSSLAKGYDFRENVFEIIDDPVADIATMPAFFQAGSKKRQAAYVSGETSINDNEQRGNKNSGVESNFLKHRKEELKSQEELKKDEQKLLRKKDFVDGKTGEMVVVERLPYNSIDVK